VTPAVRSLDSVPAPPSNRSEEPATSTRRPGDPRRRLGIAVPDPRIVNRIGERIALNLGIDKGGGMA
jgi:hypothetical protein